MTAILRAALLAGLAGASLPAVAAGQSTSADSLLRRIDLLERTTADLERRVRELETLIKIEPARDRPVAASPNSGDLANWRRLRAGMTMDNVRALLAEPERVAATGGLTIWFYPDYASVSFRSGKVDGWSEPRSEPR